MKKYLAILAMLLVIVMALCACGGDAPATKEDSNQPSSAAPAKTEAETTAPTTAEPTTEEPTTQAPPEIPDALVGTWTLSVGTCTDTDGQLITEFTIEKDGSLTVNGKTYQGEYSYNPQIPSAWFMADNLHYQISLNENGATFDGETIKGGIRLTGAGYISYSENGRFYKDLERIELTLENWQEYFDLIDKIDYEKDAFGDITCLWRRFYLVKKDNIMEVVDGAIEFSVINTCVQCCHYNTKTGEYYFADDLPEDVAAYIQEQLSHEGVYEWMSTLKWPYKTQVSIEKSYNYEDNSFIIGATLFEAKGVRFADDKPTYENRMLSGLEKDGDEVMAYFCGGPKFEVLRIKGTVIFTSTP